MCGSQPKLLKPASSDGRFQGIYLLTTSTNRMNDSNLVTTSLQPQQRLDFTSQKLGAFTVLLNKFKVFLLGTIIVPGSLSIHLIINISNEPPPGMSSPCEVSSYPYKWP